MAEIRRCPSCGASNPAGALWCGQCHRRFGEAPGPGEPFTAVPVHSGNGGRRRSARSPAGALLLSVLLPGAGHAYAGQVPEGAARGALYVWTTGMAIVLLGRAGAPGAGVVRTVGGIFAVAAALTWGVSLAEVRRIARGDRRPIVPARALTWASLALTLLLFVGLTVSVASR